VIGSNVAIRGANKVVGCSLMSTRCLHAERQEVVMDVFTSFAIGWCIVLAVTVTFGGYMIVVSNSNSPKIV
jgi:hypothetical protein